MTQLTKDRQRYCGVEFFSDKRSTILHAAFAVAVSVALVTGFWTFDWKWETTYPLRECLFLVHRTAGLVAALLGMVWLVTRLPTLLLSERMRGAKRWIKWVHVSVVFFVVVLAGTAWLGRAQDGRWVELISPVPVYNFVSRPDTSLAYLLFYAHTIMAPWLFVLVIGHSIIGIVRLFAVRR